MASFDLSRFQDLIEAQERGAECEIIDPVSGEPTGIVFIVVGPDSNVQRRARLTLQDELSAYRGRPIPADDQEKLVVEQLARCVVGWRIQEDSQDVPFSFTAVVKLLTKYRFIREQVDAFAGSRVGFAR